VQSRVAEALALVEAILNEDGPNHDEIIMERSEIIKLERVRPGFAFDITVISFHLFAPSKPNVGRGRAGEMRVPVQLVQDCVEDWSELSRRLEETEASLVTKEQMIEASFS
jgi:hypothetical protein